MKRLLACAVIVLLAIAAMHTLDMGDWTVSFGGDEYEGPLAALFSLIFGAGGLVIAAVAIVCAALFVGLLFAGLGVLMVAGLALLAVVLVAAISPFLLPLLILFGLWYMVSRRRERRQADLKEHTI
ncbi:hypothetical protein [Massilia sp. BJB1822]|uniref:hypothetical protein n=1 Tax=Massilia sp. BJB1822 TaxID=2744470 RepID=UPI00159414AA|nr:hypothetical protein [Massilia sp. BJB1822]NVE01573.1 hypothetical protein [Massilia sp. BJB1822]